MLRALGAIRRQVLAQWSPARRSRWASSPRVARHRRRPRRRRGHQPAVQGGRRRHPAQRARARAADDRHRARRRRRRDAALGPGPGPARHARAAGGGPAGGRGAAADRASPASRRAIALVVAVLGGAVARRRHLRPRRDERPAAAPWASARCCSSSPSRCWPSTSCGRLARVIGWPLQRLRPDQRPAGPRQRRPQPEPHGRDGRRAHDRPRRGRVRRRVRPGAEELVRRQLRQGRCAPTSSCRARTSCRCPSDTAGRCRAPSGRRRRRPGVDRRSRCRSASKTTGGLRRRPRRLRPRLAASTGSAAAATPCSAQLGTDRRPGRGADRLDARHSRRARRSPSRPWTARRPSSPCSASTATRWCSTA